MHVFGGGTVVVVRIKELSWKFLMKLPEIYTCFIGRASLLYNTIRVL